MNNKSKSNIKGVNPFVTKIFLIIATGAALIFSLFNIPLHFDISIAAFFVSLVATVAATFFFALFSMANNENKQFTFKAAQKSLQYLPYLLLVAFILRRAGKAGTPYWFDLVTVIFWCVSLLGRWACLHQLSKMQTELQKLDATFNATNKKKHTNNINNSTLKTLKKILFTTLDWADALVQAVFMVLLIQIFIFQLYVIPSESMVPQFLIGDRVVVAKILCAPKFPLSEVGLPQIKKFNRGDIVVFRNPHYTIDRNSEVKGVISQIVYMMTFTLVNLNKDENGQIKYDPLVKRIAGVPGECLVMQDGVLYKKTKDNPNFVAVDYDNKIAAWNLNRENQKIKNQIKDIPLTQNQYQMLLKVEEERRDLSITNTKSLCLGVAQSMKLLVNNHSRQDINKQPVPNDLNNEATAQLSLTSYDIFNNYKENVARILNSTEYLNWYVKFLCDWVDNKSLATDAHIAGVNIDDTKKNTLAADPYQDASYKLNLMIKMTVGSLYLRYAQLITEGATSDKIILDSTLNDSLKMANMLYMYISLQDQRNMCVFPAPDENGNARYIPDNSYFMMGDNRFNSLDMRHSYEQHLVPLTKYDEYSIRYNSNLAPQYVNKKYILGNAVLRFWPLGRVGVIQ